MLFVILGNDSDAMKEIPYEFHSSFNDRYAVASRKILRILSENSRTPISGIAKDVNLSRKSAKDRLKKLEEEFGIKYTLELNEEVLGLTVPHIILANFTLEPDYEHIAKMLKDSHVVQAAFSVKNKRQIVIYALASSYKDYTYEDNKILTQLSEYGVDWQSSELVHKQLGFFPFRNDRSPSRAKTRRRC
jgi:DNA-binding Lrp family transcriptional regulator